MNKLVDSMSDIKKNFIKKLFSIFEKTLSVFVSFHTRPKQSSQVTIRSDSVLNLPKMAIVIQGQLIGDLDFTLETIKIYKKIFKDIKIILSTWEGENLGYVERIRQENIEIILNKKPKNIIGNNINYQLVSSFAGINRAKDMGVEYVLKTRTDQRIYGINSMEFMFNIIKKFPLDVNYKQKKRIVGLSLNTFKYRRYGLSDMNIFGHIEDMLLYWSAELNDVSSGNGLSQLPLALAEAYLISEFMTKIGRQLKWTLEDSWKIFAEHFCVVDAQSLDIYWYKYARMKEYRYLRYDAMRNDQELSFKEWFNLYSNVENHTTDASQKLLNVIPV